MCCWVDNWCSWHDSCDGDQAIPHSSADVTGRRRYVTVMCNHGAVESVVLQKGQTAEWMRSGECSGVTSPARGCPGALRVRMGPQRALVLSCNRRTGTGSHHQMPLVLSEHTVLHLLDCGDVAKSSAGPPVGYT